MRSIQLSVVALFLNVAARANALVGVENLSQPPWVPVIAHPISDQPGTPRVGRDHANGFRTGSNGGSYALASVTLDLTDLSETPTYGGGFTVSIWSNDPIDVVGAPGTQLGVLSGSSNPVGSGYFTFNSVSPLPLSASTTYWILASVPHDGSVNSLYTWSAASATSEAGLDGWSIIDLCRPRKYQDGVAHAWGIGTGSNRFSVDVIAIPEASTLSIGIASIVAWTAFPPFVRRKRAFSEICEINRSALHR